MTDQITLDKLMTEYRLGYVAIPDGLVLSQDWQSVHPVHAGELMKAGTTVIITSLKIQNYPSGSGGIDYGSCLFAQGKFIGSSGNFPNATVDTIFGSHGHTTLKFYVEMSVDAETSEETELRLTKKQEAEDEVRYMQGLLKVSLWKTDCMSPGVEVLAVSHGEEIYHATVANILQEFGFPEINYFIWNVEFWVPRGEFEHMINCALISGLGWNWYHQNGNVFSKAAELLPEDLKTVLIEKMSQPDHADRWTIWGFEKWQMDDELKAAAIAVCKGKGSISDLRGVLKKFNLM